MQYPTTAFYEQEERSPISLSKIDRFVDNSTSLKLFFWALHNETRLSIIKELSFRPRNVKELSNLIGELHSVTSFHLKHLRIHNLVEYEIEGKERIYKLTSILNDLTTAINECNNILVKE